jgi:hypothetical protein
VVGNRRDTRLALTTFLAFLDDLRITGSGVNKGCDGLLAEADLRMVVQA